MQKITPFLWITHRGEEAANLYVSVFPNSRINSIARHSDEAAKATGMPKDSAMVIDLVLEGQSLQILNGGPTFEHSSSVSLFAVCSTAAQVDAIYEKLSTGGKTLIPIGAYPFSDRYVFFSDKFGVHWQLIHHNSPINAIMPSIIFGGERKGWGPQALDYYRKLFKNSRTLLDERYKKEGPGIEGSLAHARVELEGSQLVLMDSGHEFPMPMTGAISLTIHCKDQAEVDYYWDTIAKDGTPNQCGWIVDRFGVFWQVVPSDLGKYIGGPDPAGARRAMGAMLQMRKLDIGKIKEAYLG